MSALTANPESRPRLPHLRLTGLCLSGLLLALTQPAQANDFPTLARVLYVEECQINHPGPPYEMRSKCACALDHLASQVSHDQYDTLKTATNAMSIGGERGGALRDNPQTRPSINRLKALEAEAAQACFLKPAR
jgi:hypothetical protein